MIERNNRQENDLDYMKSRFGLEFVQKIEVTLKLVASLKYDVELFRMHTSSYALKKDTDVLENKLATMTPMNKHLDLMRRCDDYALSFDMIKVNDSLKKLEKSLASYSLTSDMLYQVQQCRDELRDSIDVKVNNSVFLSRCQSIEESIT